MKIEDRQEGKTEGYSREMDFAKKRDEKKQKLLLFA